VRVSASEFAGQVEIRVTDHGPGTSSSRRADVFLPFQRLGDTDNLTGLGLGLAIAKGFAEGMDGTLEADDTPGDGVTMVISLPAAEPAVAAESRQSRGRVATMKILIADDDPQILRALRITLGARGYDIITAGDGADALNAVIEQHPDLLVLELGMPRLDGLAVISAVRGWSQVPILVVSGRTG
jgi:hypothetical protein